VFCGPSCVFTNVLNPRSHTPRKDEYRPTKVGNGATIGANATVICGVAVGEHSFIGAGAVVTSDVPAFGLVLGVPARLVGWMCRCGEQLGPTSPEASCSKCGAEYRETDRVLEQIVASKTHG
jgi:UDP-2-acetamido-3-amino-2,3-dideoxy-glucuronate N-acetyltransferase